MYDPLSRHFHSSLLLAPNPQNYFCLLEGLERGIYGTLGTKRKIYSRENPATV